MRLKRLLDLLFMKPYQFLKNFLHFCQGKLTQKSNSPSLECYNWWYSTFELLSCIENSSITSDCHNVIDLRLVLKW